MRVAQHLIIELDGSRHAEPQEEHKDGLRTSLSQPAGLSSAEVLECASK
jgi:very-short-patch-repair endonuclease